MQATTFGLDRPGRYGRIVNDVHTQHARLSDAITAVKSGNQSQITFVDVAKDEMSAVNAILEKHSCALYPTRSPNRFVLGRAKGSNALPVVTCEIA